MFWWHCLLCTYCSHLLLYLISFKRCLQSLFLLIFLLWNLSIGRSTHSKETSQTRSISYWECSHFTKIAFVLKTFVSAKHKKTKNMEGTNFWKLYRFSCDMCFVVSEHQVSMWQNLFLGYSRGHTLFTVWLIFNLKGRIILKTCCKTLILTFYCFGFIKTWFRWYEMMDFKM